MSRNAYNGNIKLLETIATALIPLLDDVVFVGGTVVNRRERIWQILANFKP